MLYVLRKMKVTIITAILSLLVGFALGYHQNLRETDEYIHVVQVNGTIIEGDSLTIGTEELNELNDLIFRTYGQDHKILQILVKTEEKVVMYIGGRTKGEPDPHYTSETPITAEKKNGAWTITEIKLGSAI